jgi:hypothetical protein
MASTKLSGLAIAEGIAGFVLLWSGLRNQTLKTTVTDLLKGQVPPDQPETAPTVGVGHPSAATDSSTAAGSTTATATATAPSSSGSPGAVNGCTAAQTAANKAMGQLLATAYGWGSGAEWNALNGVVMLESGWCNVAQNPSSTAYGIGQFLDTTWSGVGYSKSSNPATQIAAMLKYIKQRYGTPEAAYSFHIANGYY